MESSRSTRLLIPITDQYQSMIDTPCGRSFHMDSAVRQCFDNIDSFARGHLSCLEACSASRSAANFASLSRSHLDL
jgi:hypothetical protein